MSEHKTISAYLTTVAEQIRWKRARPVVLSELEHHLEDQRDAFLSEGCDNAEQLAVEEMGDPVSVGTELDLIHRPKPQWGLLSLTILLALAGMILRICLDSHQPLYHANPDPVSELPSFVLGCVVLLAGYFLDYARLARHGWKIYIAALLISILSLRLSPIIYAISFYTRYVILCFPVIYAFLLYSCRGKGYLGLLLAILGGIPMALICTITPYIFGLLLLLLTGFVLLLTASYHDWFGIGRRKSTLFLCLCAAVVLVISFCYLVFELDLLVGLGIRGSYFHFRLDTALHPEQDPMGEGYQAMTIRSAVDAARWLGAGASFSPLPYEQTVPNADSDNLLTTLIYKLGWLPFLIVALVFSLLMAWLICRCLKHKSQLGRLVALSVILSLCLQALCSTAWNLGFTLIGGATFPLMMGNLNTIINMGLIGLALSVFRGESIARDRLDTVKRPHYRIKLVVQKS